MVRTRASRLIARVLRRVVRPFFDEPAVPDLTPAVGPGFADIPIRMSLDELLATELGRYFKVLHVISLSGFRDAVGDQWARLAEKVLLIADSVISRQLGSDGIFGRRGADMFVLVFSHATESEARARAEAIGVELGERLLGSARFSADGLVHVAHMDAATALDGGDLDLSKLQAAVTEARELASEALGAPLPLRRHLVPSDNVEVERRWRRFHQPRPATLVGDDAAPAAERLAAEYRMEFLPTWIAAEAALGANLCRMGNAAGRLAAPYADPGVGFALDRRLAAQAAALLPELRGVLIVPIAFASLLSRKRLLLTGDYHAIPEALRLLRLDVEVFGIPDSASPRQLLDAVAAVKPLARSLLLRMRPGQDSAALAADCGFDGVGIDAAELPPDLADEFGVTATLEALRRNATAAGLAAYAWNLRSRAAVRAGVAAGLDRLNGPALARAAARPPVPIPAGRDRLLKS